MKTRLRKILKGLGEGKLDEDGFRVRVKHWLCESCETVKDVGYDEKNGLWIVRCPSCKMWFDSLKSTRMRRFVQRFLSLPATLIPT